jgi:tetratricopeptide (TPR) repeat protein
MGVVFKAVDTRLERVVAVKVLSPELFTNEVARARFIREAKLAAAITHPNVATIHEIDEQDGMPFIAMEMVPGTNLKNLLSDHPLALSEVIGIGKQVCDALAMAHERGVIHRDIKSSNIMVTPSGEVKVLDFGLAKALAEPVAEVEEDEDDRTRERELYPEDEHSPKPAHQARSLTTAHGVALGTPSYMSPEQASGKPVDARTDIFSLGVVLYEAASGTLPFKGKTDHELLQAIRSKDPTPLQVEGTRVPRDFSKVISTCLSKQPEQRYTSAAALHGDLLQLEKRLSWKHILLRSLMQKPAGRMGLVAALILLVAALMQWPPTMWFRGGGILAPGAMIVMADLDNQTVDGRLDSVQTLFDMLLRQSAHFSIMTRSDMRKSLQKMVLPQDKSIDLELARNIAWREHHPIVIGASLLSVGSHYVFTVQMDRIGESPSPQAAWSSDFRAVNPDELYDAIDKASYWVRQKIGEAAEQLESLSTPARDATTSSWEALDLYTRAENAQYSGRNEEARSLLKEAVSLDPEFALAWARLADISYMAEQDQVYDYYRRAFEAMEHRHLTKREELRIKAVFAHDTHDFDNATELFRAFALTYPNDYVATTGYAYSLLKHGLEKEALELLIRAESIRPEAYQPFANSARVHLMLGQLDAIPDYVDRLQDMGLGVCADWVEGHRYFTSGEFDKAIEFFQQTGASSIPMWRHRGISYTASVLAELGRFQEAIAILEEGTHIDINTNRANDAADKLLASAYIQLRRGDNQACRNACLDALDLDRGSIRRLRAGVLLAQSGHIQEAEEIYNSLPARDDIVMYNIIRHRVLGEILLSQGNVSEAVKEFRRAYELDAPIHQNEYLARSLLQSGDVEEARQLYGEMSASFSRLLWHDSLFLFPGLWANVVYHYGVLSYELGDEGEAKLALKRYLDLRKGADAEIQEVVRARQLLSSMSENAHKKTSQ